MDTVALQFNYTQAEYVKADRQYLFASRTITKTSVVVLAIYLPFSVFYLFFSSFCICSILALMIGVLCLMLGCILYFFIPGYKFRQTAKYQEEYHLAFSNDAILFQTPTLHSELKWDIYSALWESDDFYFLIQAPRHYTLLPKRAFASLATQQSFEEIALSNLNCTMRKL